LNPSLKRSLLSRGYRANLVPGETELYDIYQLVDGKDRLFAANQTEAEAWQIVAGQEETQP
jgi:hypothetical protein